MSHSVENIRLQSIHDLLGPLIKGRRLLDIGTIGHEFEARQEIGTFYLSEFVKKAGYVKGIDILEEDVARARAAGFEVVVGDAESFVDAEPYDVVFAGELIEHLSNPGLFLRCSIRNLKKDGVLVITTPNAFSMSRLLKCVFGLTNEPPVNPEHTCYYTPQTLRQLSDREGFEIKRIYFSDYDYGTRGVTMKRAVMLRINRVLCDLFPQFSQSFIAVLGRPSEGRVELSPSGV
jgi:2-polyprenyl-3-methyl-5-hydroxy-6-metoxy-1,4-benzoquinol methylase